MLPATLLQGNPHVPGVCVTGELATGLPPGELDNSRLCSTPIRLGAPLVLICGPGRLQALAVDVSLAALLGDDVYSFGELLLHPIVRVHDWSHGCALSPYRTRHEHAPPPIS